MLAPEGRRFIARGESPWSRGQGTLKSESQPGKGGAGPRQGAAQSHRNPTRGVRPLVMNPRPCGANGAWASLPDLTRGFRPLAMNPRPCGAKENPVTLQQSRNWNAFFAVSDATHCRPLPSCGVTGDGQRLTAQMQFVESVGMQSGTHRVLFRGHRQRRRASKTAFPRRAWERVKTAIKPLLETDLRRGAGGVE